LSIKNKSGHYRRTVATHGRKSGHWLTQYADIDNSNRAELYAIVSALRLIDEQCKASVEIRTDANSLVKVAKPKNLQKFNKFGWPEQWCTNSDLWKEFFRFTNQRAIQVTWVKGHDRDEYNNLCDKIAGKCSELSLSQQ